MKETNGEIRYKDKMLKIVFNLNVMEAIQEEYGSLEAWGKLTDGSEGEVNAKAVIYGITQMINEGIDIENEENGTNIKPYTLKQVGRIITECGLQNITKDMNDTVIASTESEQKNS